MLREHVNRVQFPDWPFYFLSLLNNNNTKLSKYFYSSNFSFKGVLQIFFKKAKIILLFFEQRLIFDVLSISTNTFLFLIQSLIVEFNFKFYLQFARFLFVKL